MIGLKSDYWFQSTPAASSVAPPAPPPLPSSPAKVSSSVASPAKAGGKTPKEKRDEARSKMRNGKDLCDRLTTVCPCLEGKTAHITKKIYSHSCGMTELKLCNGTVAVCSGKKSSVFY